MVTKRLAMPQLNHDVIVGDREGWKLVGMTMDANPGQAYSTLNLSTTTAASVSVKS